MQTFLPSPRFAESARCLDRARLGKQRVEAKQILLALRDPAYGWQNHPAVKMWRGHEDALIAYGMTVCVEWRRRGYADTLLPFFAPLPADHDLREPPWLGDPAFHASHRSNLLRKDPTWYGRFGWEEPPDLPYVWPVN